jgi:CRISPR/Cas system-associated exonuclease Cas4 (RecB family)
VWVSWLCPLLAGEAQCSYAAWMKSRYRDVKRSDPTFDLAAWNAAHTALLARRTQELLDTGWRVRIENENAFRLKGASAILAGKPDLLALREGVVRVIDGKTGQPKNRDWHQCLIYMWAVPKVWPEFTGWTIEGEVAYLTHAIPIAAQELSRERIDAIGAAMKAVAGSATPEPHPSAAECARCDLDGCRARIEGGIAEAMVAEF